MFTIPSRKIPEIIEKYSRQILVKEIGVDGLIKLMKSKIAIIGCGAIGSTAAELFARAGVGFIRLIDRDFVDKSNLPRTLLYTEEDAEESMPKALAAANRIKKVNSIVKTEPIITNIDPSNIEDLIRDTDLVFDGTDNLDVRLIINEAAVKLGKPWIYVGIEQWYGMIMPIIPKETACLRCLISGRQRYLNNVCEIMGVMNTAVAMVTSIAVNEAIKYILGFKIGGYILLVNAYKYSIEKVRVLRNPKCPLCSKNVFEHLGKKRLKRALRVCGTNAVQVYPKSQLDISKIINNVKRNKNIRVEISTPYVLRIKYGDYKIVLFNDGRAIIEGTTNEELALKIYEEIAEKTVS